MSNLCHFASFMSLWSAPHHSTLGFALPTRSDRNPGEQSVQGHLSAFAGLESWFSEKIDQGECSGPTQSLPGLLMYILSFAISWHKINVKRNCRCSQREITPSQKWKQTSRNMKSLLEIRYSTFHFYEITHIVHVMFLPGVEGLKFIVFINFN